MKYHPNLMYWINISRQPKTIRLTSNEGAAITCMDSAGAYQINNEVLVDTFWERYPSWFGIPQIQVCTMELLSPDDPLSFVTMIERMLETETAQNLCDHHMYIEWRRIRFNLNGDPKPHTFAVLWCIFHDAKEEHRLKVVFDEDNVEFLMN